jgi:hypothetical protein
MKRLEWSIPGTEGITMLDRNWLAPAFAVGCLLALLSLC